MVNNYKIMNFLYIADINAFAFSPLNLSNPLIFRIVKNAKVAEVIRKSVNFKENQRKLVC